MGIMRAVAPTTGIMLALVLALSLAGCGDFWQNPSGTSTGTTATTTTLTASSTSTTVGATVTLTASVTPTAATGTVTFYDNDTDEIGTATLSSGTASTSISFTSVGTASVTATYGGNSTYASSTSSAVSITVAAASSGSSFVGAFDPAKNAHATNLVLDPTSTWTVTATSYVGNLSGLAIDGDTIRNIYGDGHCVYYSGSIYTPAGAAAIEPAPESDAKGIYALSGGGFLAPAGATGLNCN